MNCLLVDDDEMTRKLTESMCAQVEGLVVVHSCGSAVEAMNYLRLHPVDLMFLDVEMPGMSGLELLRSSSELPAVILTTGRAEYAAEAFDLPVADYLTKPISLARFMRAIGRVRKQQPATSAKANGELYVKNDGRLVRLSLGDILYVESLGDYVAFCMDQGNKMIVHSTLRNIEERIHNPDFLRVHRSFIVNLSKIVDIEENNLVVKNKVIPVSRTHRPELLNKINTI